MSLSLPGLALLWLAGTFIRIYRQARFFQIEEYQSLRYLRWFSQHREHWSIWSIGAAAVGIVLAFFTDSIPGQQNLLPFVFAAIAAIIAIWPQNEGEIKKAFVRTQRATRLLGAAFVIATIVLVNALIV